MIRALIMCSALCAATVAVAGAQAQMPIVSDSRIKTLVYNPNDVYSLLTHYGYQSNIEFGPRESVQTVSVGDRVAWQIIPAGRRLFIKAMEEKAHTNMTVVTNKRAYQFDLRSSGRTPLHPTEELVYVARFFYPDAQTPPPVTPTAPPPAAAVAQAAPLMPAIAPTAAPMSALQASAPLNYQYTLSGPEAIAPVRVYDDGSRTYLQFPAGLNAPVQLFAVLADGRMQPLSMQRGAGGELFVNGVAPRLIVRSGRQEVIIYNEARG